MRYKVLGFVVWQVTKWYLRRRVGRSRRRKMALAAVSAAVVAGVLVAGRHASNSE
jgi:hypothetical protein